MVGNRYALPNSFQSASQHEEITIIQYPPHFNILGLCYIIPDNLHFIVFRIDQQPALVHTEKDIVKELFEYSLRIVHGILNRFRLPIYHQYLKIIFITDFFQLNIILLRSDISCT